MPDEIDIAAIIGTIDNLRAEVGQELILVRDYLDQGAFMMAHAAADRARKGATKIEQLIATLAAA